MEQSSCECGSAHDWERRSSFNLIKEGEEDEWVCTCCGKTAPLNPIPSP